VTTQLSQHTLDLATELLKEIELSQGSAAVLVLKGARLARLVGDDETEAWLHMELYGYSDNDLGRKYMALTGRWINRDSATGDWQGISQIEAQVTAQEGLLASLRLPDLSGDMILLTIRDVQKNQAKAASAIGILAGIRAKVIALLHQFASTRYYELAFSERQAELVEQARRRVDSLLAPLSGNALGKVDSIYQRLGEGEEEAISHALTTCRRLIDSVANAIYPPTDAVIDVGGRTVNLRQQHIQNRLNAYLIDRTPSESRRKKLRRTLSDLYDRVSTGVHTDVSSEEARFLFLNTYLYLGEVLALGEVSS
jgi:hypothetical protein